MNFPKVRRIRRPVYVFSDDGANTHVDKYRGLLRFSPFKPADVSHPHCLFIFSEQDKDLANQLYLALKNGIASFPGSHQFVGVSFSKDQVEPLRLSPSAFNPGSETTLFSTVSSHVENSGRKPDFTYIIGDQNWKYQRPSPYGAIKAALLRHRVPSQMVSRQLLRVESQFRYAVPNIALCTLAKLGGVPWLIKRTEESPSLIIGVGTTVVRDRVGSGVERFLGYAICMLSTGLFLDLDFFGVATTHREFLANLTGGLGGALDRLSEQQKGVSKVTLHVPHLERRDTCRAISAVLHARKQAHPSPVAFELLRLSHDSPFMVMDADHPGFVAEEGTIVDLTPRHSLVVTEGKFEKAQWRGRKPVTLEIHREYCSQPPPSFRDSLQDAFHLGFVNWQGFGAKTKPATLAYAKMLSDRVADLSAVCPDVIDMLSSDSTARTGLWFL